MGERVTCFACNGSEVLWSAADAAYVDCGCRKRRKARPRPTIRTMGGETGEDRCALMFGHAPTMALDGIEHCPAPTPGAP
jgi:hypothetical protein